MNARIASFGSDLDRRLIVAIDIFRWNLRLGFAIAPRDMADLRQRRRRRARLSDVPPCLREDVGLPPEEVFPLGVVAAWHLSR